MASLNIVFPTPFYNIFNANFGQVNISWKAFMQHSHSEQKVNGKLIHMNTRILRV